jgi:cytochrome P450
MGAMPSLNGIYDYVEMIISPKMYKQRFQFMAAARNVAAARMKEQDSKGVDIYGKMIGAKDPETGEGFSPAELIAESMLLIIAGTLTGLSRGRANAFRI